MTATNAYAQSGVDYALLDPSKVDAQRAALATSVQLLKHGFNEVTASRGESAHVVDLGPFYLASIVECLGTKALVADAMAAIDGKSRYDRVAQDTIAMAVNDLITVGATPLVVHAYWAAGASDWFTDVARKAALIEGWKRACEFCGVAWGGGETPALSGVVEKERVDLAASCVGIVNPKNRLILGQDLRAGDKVILLGSSGIHANGLSLARKLVADKALEWTTPVGDTTYGDALLEPTRLYAPVLEEMWNRGVEPHYCANITGHGWSKLARHPGDFTIYINALPQVPRVLDLIQKVAGISDTEAYTTLNMGAGFALFVEPDQEELALEIAKRAGVSALSAGEVMQGRRGVNMWPLGLWIDPPAIR